MFVQITIHIHNTNIIRSYTNLFIGIEKFNIDLVRSCLWLIKCTCHLLSDITCIHYITLLADLGMSMFARFRCGHFYYFAWPTLDHYHPTFTKSRTLHRNGFASPRVTSLKIIITFGHSEEQRMNIFYETLGFYWDHNYIILYCKSL